jgi:hypothetical protein
VSIADEPVAWALERRYGLDLAPLRRVADASPGPGYWEAAPWLERGDVPLDVIPGDALASLRATAAAQRAVMRRRG